VNAPAPRDVAPPARLPRPVRMFVTAAAIVVADQIVKRAVVAFLNMGDPVNVLGSVARFTRTENTGAAFGVFQGRGVWFIVVSAAAGIAIAAFSREIAKMRRGEQIAFGLILGGAVGNLIDRVRLGAVVDFIDIGVNNVRWPSFNVADSGITIGVTLLAIHLLFLSRSGQVGTPSEGSQAR
jgi:signal peptidase II